MKTKISVNEKRQKGNTWKIFLVSLTYGLFLFSCGGSEAVGPVQEKKVVKEVKLPKVLLGNNDILVTDNDGADWVAASLPEEGKAEQLSSDPFDSNRVMLIQNKKLYLSANAGRVWGQPVFNSTTEKAWVASFHPDKPNTLFLFVTDKERSLLVSENSGKDWVKRSAVTVINNDFPSLHISSTNPSRLFLTTGGDGVFRSDDEGKTWTGINTGLMKNVGGALIAPVEGVALHPINPNVMYLAIDAIGVYKTVNGGEEWKMVSKVIPQEGHAGGMPWKIAIDPQNPERLIIATHWEIVTGVGTTDFFLSVDGGENWKEINYPKKVPILDPAAEEVSTTIEVYDLNFVPGDKNLAIANTEIGLIKLKLSK